MTNVPAIIPLTPQSLKNKNPKFDNLPASERALLLKLLVKPGVTVHEDKITLKKGDNAYLYLMDLSKYDDIRYTWVVMLETDDTYWKRFNTYLEALKGYKHVKSLL